MSESYLSFSNEKGFMNLIITNSGKESLLKIFEYYKQNDHVVFVPEYGCSDIYSSLYSSNVSFYIYPISRQYLIETEVFDRILKFPDKFVLLIVHNHGMLGYDEKIKTKITNKNIEVIEDCALLNYSEVLGTNSLLSQSSKIFSFGPGKAVTFAGGGLLLTNKNIGSEKFRLDILFFFKFATIVLIRSNKKIFSFLKCRAKYKTLTAIKIVKKRKVCIVQYMFIFIFKNLSKYFNFKTNKCLDFKNNYYEPISNYCIDYKKRLYFNVKAYTFLKKTNEKNK